MTCLANLEKVHGAELAVTPLGGDAHKRINPLTELADMMPGKPIITVVAP